jgi:NAD(P)-dependent dehydrogenase (short-subunit alcohol dehydrogenase family)
MGKYDGKKAVITGGTMGMGLAIAQHLADGGAEVLVTGTTDKNLAVARERLGGRAQVVRSDTSALSELSALAQRVGQTLGKLDAVFINAGVATLTPIVEVTEAEYDRAFAINTRGAFFAAQSLAPLVRPGGAFVFTTSIANQTGYPGMSVYAGTKAALRAFAQAFAVELLPRNIRVNALSPGFIKTETMGVAGASADELRAFEAEGVAVTPMKRIGTVDEVARAALFLAFDATFTTGIELLLDGGMSTLTVPHAVRSEAS